MPFHTLKCYMDAVMSDTFDFRYDKRTTYLLKSNEAYVVPGEPPYRAVLAEKPYKAAGITLPGYTEVDAMPGSAGEFFVDYEYGYIYFHQDNKNAGILVTYYGMGSIVRAADVNRFAEFLNTVRPLMSALEVIALEPAGRMVRVREGSIHIHSNYIAFLRTNLLDFGPGGAHQLDALSLSYYAKVVVCVNYEEVAPQSADIEAWFSAYQGLEAPTADQTLLPDVPLEAIPIAVVRVQDDGSGSAGTIVDIESEHITDCRPLFTGGVWDHGGALGLSDDDHPQYLKKTGDTITGNISAGAGIMFDGRDLSEDGIVIDSLDTPAKLFDQIKQVDGSGSGLDADKLDGYHAETILSLGGGSQIITFYQEGDAIENETWLSGFLFQKNITVKAVMVLARSQPTNSNLEIAILKDSLEVITVTVTAGQYQGSVSALDISFLSNASLGIRSKAVGSGNPGGKYTVCVFYDIAE